MKCFNHTEVDANGTCNNCNIALCGDCVSRFDFPLCESCLLKHNNDVSKDLYLGLAITIVVFIGATYFFYNNLDKGDLLKAMFGGGLMAGTYWGWKFLSDYLPRLERGTSVVWFIYLIIKFIISYFIGLFIGPYQIFKMFRELTKIQKVKKQIARGEI